MVETQKELFDRLFAGCRTDDLRDFIKWVKVNQHIYNEFRRLAHEYKNAGNNKCSHWLLANVIRWNQAISSGTGKWKIKNLHIAYLARMLVFREPAFDGFFSLNSWRKSDCTDNKTFDVQS